MRVNVIFFGTLSRKMTTQISLRYPVYKKVNLFQKFPRIEKERGDKVTPCYGVGPRDAREQANSGSDVLCAGEQEREGSRERGQGRVAKVQEK